MTTTTNKNEFNANSKKWQAFFGGTCPAQTPVTVEELQTFLADLNARCRASWVANYLSEEEKAKAGAFFDENEALGAEVGPKYIRIVKHQAPKPDDAAFMKPRPVTTATGVVNRVVRCAFCFIDGATGNILKTSGFSQPAKGVRGNIRDTGWWDKSVSPYGAVY